MKRDKAKDIKSAEEIKPAPQNIQEEALCAAKDQRFNPLSRFFLP
jgi:hypothetical protein